MRNRRYRSTDSSEEETERPASQGGPLSTVLPAAEYIVSESKRLIENGKISINDLATCIAQDPALTLELIKVANETQKGKNRPVITTPQNAVVALGSMQVLEVVETVEQRESYLDEKIEKALEEIRFYAQRTAIIANIVANASRKDLSREAQTVTLMNQVGLMLACCYFGHDYISLAEGKKHSAIVYRLKNVFNFNAISMQRFYLQRNGFPDVLLFAIDPDQICSTPWRRPLRNLLEAATEIVQSFDYDRWERLAPGKSLPSSSPIKLLNFQDFQWERIYQRCENYLEAAKNSRNNQIPDEPELLAEEESEEVEEMDSIASFLTPLEDEEEEEFTDAEKSPFEDIDNIASDVLKALDQQVEEEIQEIKKAESIKANGNEQFEDEEDELAPTDKKMLFYTPPEPEFEHVDDFDVNNPPEDFRYTKSAQWVTDSFSGLFSNAKDSQSLVQEVMEKITNSGPFTRAALVELEEDRESARVLSAIGEDMIPGDRVTPQDALCPLFSCLQTVKSFATDSLEERIAPFGSTSFAISPLDVGGDNPIALYVDCGIEQSMPFEARRIFRMLVFMLNNVLPQIPGSIGQGGEFDGAQL